MEYHGAYELFDLSRVRTYPLQTRPNKVELDNLVDCPALRDAEPQSPSLPWFRNGVPGAGDDQSAGLRKLARRIVECRRDGKPVVVLTGAHAVKNGEIAIVIDLIERGLVTFLGTNGAATIHSFELALTGASSESVRDALPNGDFGMAFETGAYLNYAVRVGCERGWGMGEAMGRLYCDSEFRRAVLDRTFEDHPDTGEYLRPYDGFPYVDSCVFAAAYRSRIPICVHASLGTDIIDQHASFEPAAKGWASGVDFLVLAREMCRFTGGGVVLNIGTAVMGPEVLLKAVSMAANIGQAPQDLWTGDFDIRPFTFDDAVRDESQPYYYLRDQKSVATRIPKVFGGTGFYFEGPHRQTLPALYQYIMAEVERE